MQQSEQPLSAGAIRERIWSELVRQNACAYPIPPHGHNPNFKGARAAARHLMLHPLMAAANVVLVGMEAALLPLREEVLARAKTLIVPHRTKANTYWKLERVPKAAAKIPNFSLYGEATTLEGIEACVLASVAVDKSGQRLSKGFGFGAHGAPVTVPTLTIAHQIMSLEVLGVEADSVVIAHATPSALHHSRLAADPL